jgi:hypothetical protein
MPMPIPINTEDKETFIKRFMADEKMMMEYPDEKQRYAIAEEQWNSVDRYNAGNEIEDGLYLFANEKILAGEQEQWINAFPRGVFWVEKYGKDFDFNDEFFSQIANAFDSQYLSKPKIDKDHEFKSSYGSLLKYRINNNGMQFLTKLTPKGSQLVSDEEYCYISPAWGKTKDTRKNIYPNRLMALSLVNFPALEGELGSIKEERYAASKFDIITIKPTKKKEAKMELYVLAKELGLNSEASVDAIYSEVLVLKSKVSGYETENTELKNKCKTAEDTAIKLSKELKDQKDAELKKEAFEYVRKCIELGKVHPAIQDIVIDRYVLNKESVTKEMDLIPEKTYTGKKAANGGEGELNPETKTKMLKAGLDPENKEDVSVALSRWGGK